MSFPRKSEKLKNVCKAHLTVKTRCRCFTACETSLRYFSWRFCLCILITMPLLGISSIGVALNMRAIEGDYSSGIVSESVNSVKTVTAFGLQPRLLERYEEKLEEHMTDERAIRKLSALGTGVASSTVFMILAAAVWGINVFISRGLMEVDIATIVTWLMISHAFGLTIIYT